MRTLKYKTLRGFIKSAGHNQITVEQLFSGRYFNDKKGWSNFLLSYSARNEAAKIVSDYVCKSKDSKKRMFEGMKKGTGDFSMFQCFYIYIFNGKINVSNSLSGEAFDYCKRMYLKSIK